MFPKQPGRRAALPHRRSGGCTREAYTQRRGARRAGARPPTTGDAGAEIIRGQKGRGLTAPRRARAAAAAARGRHTHTHTAARPARARAPSTGTRALPALHRERPHTPGNVSCARVYSCVHTTYPPHSAAFPKGRRRARWWRGHPKLISEEDRKKLSFAGNPGGKGAKKGQQQQQVV